MRVANLKWKRGHCSVHSHYDKENMSSLVARHFFFFFFLKELLQTSPSRDWFYHAVIQLSRGRKITPSVTGVLNDNASSVLLHVLWFLSRQQTQRISTLLSLGLFLPRQQVDRENLFSRVGSSCHINQCIGSRHYITQPTCNLEQDTQ